MREFPGWRPPTVDWPTVAELGQSQVRQVVADLSARADLMRAIPSHAVEVAALTRSRCERLPSAVVGELRRRVNPLDLATKHDVEVQSKLGRNRVSFVLKEFLEEQLGRDQALMETIRAELHEELQAFAAALNDTMFAIDASAPPPDTQHPPRRAADVDLGRDDDDDEIDGIDEIDEIDDDWIRSER